MNSVYILYIGRPIQFLLIWFGVWSFSSGGVALENLLSDRWFLKKFNGLTLPAQEVSMLFKLKFILPLVLGLLISSAQAQTFQDGKDAAQRGDFEQAFDIWLSAEPAR